MFARRDRTLSFIVWLTGQPGTGKTTLANEIASYITWRPIEVVDGDVLRGELPGLGWSPRDRDLNVRAAGLLARSLARHGIGVLVALVSPFRETREEVRQKAAYERIPFIEVALVASPEIRAHRKPDIYARAARGELELPYEPSESGMIILTTDTMSVVECRNGVLAVLRGQGLL
jgi:adenylylsulfate kinase